MRTLASLQFNRGKPMKNYSCRLGVKIASRRREVDRERIVLY
jgi:hypothetical protein